MWFIFLFPILAWSQSDIDLSAIQDLESILPDQDIRQGTYRNIEFEKKNRDFRPPVRIVELAEIKSSPTRMAHLKAGTSLYRVDSNKPVKLTKEIYLRVFSLQDELEFVYIQNKDRTVTYKVHSDYVTRIEGAQSMYENPIFYTPADPDLIRSEYDKKLRLVPEAAFYAGLVQGSYIRDLFNDPKGRSGNMNQYGLHYFTQWKLPVKVGAAVHYERSSYNLARGGLAFYQSLSIGPQFRTKDFDLFETNWRLTTQIRVSPFSKLRGETVNGDVEFKFNSTDLMTTAEHPWKNRFGQFVIGAFHQAQWLNMKDQPQNVSVRASNQTNQSFGLFLAQVFQ